MCTEQSFIFHTDVYKTQTGKTFSIEINDQNVTQFEFINLSKSIVTINNSIVLEPRDQPNYQWKEDINENEKTQTIYKIQMSAPVTTTKRDFGLVVIQKMKAKPRG